MLLYLMKDARIVMCSPVVALGRHEHKEGIHVGHEDNVVAVDEDLGDHQPGARRKTGRQGVVVRRKHGGPLTTTLDGECRIGVAIMEDEIIAQLRLG